MLYSCEDLQHKSQITVNMGWLISKPLCAFLPPAVETLAAAQRALAIEASGVGSRYGSRSNVSTRSFTPGIEFVQARCCSQNADTRVYNWLPSHSGTV
jgi:hypothetical protein